VQASVCVCEREFLGILLSSLGGGGGGGGGGGDQR
jgi:hypothetical protein